LHYPLSYRDLEEMFRERGFEVDHSTINRWVLADAPMIEERLRQFRQPHCGSVRIDETYVKIRGKWRYLYRAIDKHGNPVDFLLTAKNMPKIGGFQSFKTARRTIAGFEAMLWLRKDFGCSGSWTVNDQNDLLARLFGFKKLTKHESSPDMGHSGIVESLQQARLMAWPLVSLQPDFCCILFAVTSKVFAARNPASKISIRCRLKWGAGTSFFRALSSQAFSIVVRSNHAVDRQPVTSPDRRIPNIVHRISQFPGSTGETSCPGRDSPRSTAACPAIHSGRGAPQQIRTYDDDDKTRADNGQGSHHRQGRH
jgi:hypothetical protein